MKLVSIIIPYYKKKNIIKTTIKSILSQNYKNYEVIIVYDDPDKSDLIYLNEIVKGNKKFKFIINKHNLGAGISRNKGIKNARGDYIAFLDADDTWKFNKLNSQIRFMENKGYDFTHTSYDILNSKNKKVGSRKAKDLTHQDLLKSCDIGLSTVIVKKKYLKNNPFPSLKTKEDYVLWLKLTKNKKFYALKNSLTSWRMLKNSLSSSTIRKLIDGYRVYRNYKNQNIINSLYSLLILSLNYLKK